MYVALPQMACAGRPARRRDRRRKRGTRSVAHSQVAPLRAPRLPQVLALYRSFIRTCRKVPEPSRGAPRCAAAAWARAWLQATPPTAASARHK